MRKFVELLFIIEQSILPIQRPQSERGIVVQALIVHCHPEPASFNASLTGIAVKKLQQLGHNVRVSDLYAEQFDPAEKSLHYSNRENPEFFSALAEQRHASRTNSLPPDVCREISRLEQAELVVFQFPLWWHGPPAMLKGWFDRVFVSGGLYTSTMRYDRGHFRGKRAMCSVTAGAPSAAFEPGGRGGDIMHLLWPVHYSLHYMGFSILPPFLASGVQGHGFAYQDEAGFKLQLDQHKVRWLDRLESMEQVRPLAFPGWGDWDEIGRQKSRSP